MLATSASMIDVPVTIDRVLRALVGQLIGEGRSHAAVGNLLGTTREQITKYVGNSSTETRTITMEHIRHFAETFPGGARAVLAKLDGIARSMPDELLTADEVRTTGVKKGRPKKLVVATPAQPFDAVAYGQAKMRESKAAAQARLATGGREGIVRPAKPAPGKPAPKPAPPSRPAPAKHPR